MKLLDRIEKYAKKHDIAYINSYTNESITYRSLSEISNRLAKYLQLNYNEKRPVIVYGHKTPLMIASFIGCVKAGHPYCPVDTSMPEDRLKDIISVSKAELLLKLEETNVVCKNTMNSTDILNLPSTNADMSCKNTEVSGDNVFYIIFTSGSTGKPKGVQITANCLDNYLDWMETIAIREGFDDHPIFLNQAPFSFDLSVMDLYTSLYLGGTIFSLDRAVQDNLSIMFEKLRISGVTTWVSTPTFMNMCLFSPFFNQNMLQNIKSFLFCGEVLSNKTARELHKRFPRAKVINTYGPTESTVAVTSVVITEEMANSEVPLPIGYAKPGTEIFIMNDNYEYPGLPEGERGEIVIAGNTVAQGYLNMPDLTAEKFFTIHTAKGNMRAYKTGDEGVKKEGLLYYSGRMDFQLKINGYRVELGDIESNILKLDNIKTCIVLPIEKNNVNKGFAAFISLEKSVEDKFEYSQIIRKQLMDMLPYYMIPKKYIFLENLPRTNNEKIDRQALKEMMLKEI